jgi:RHS repeat-associated protein
MKKLSTTGAMDGTATDITTYKWNEEGQLTAATTYENYADYAAGTGGTETQFGYDPFGDMVSETSGGATQYFIYDGQSVVLVFNGSGTLIQRQLDQVLAVEEVGGENPGVNWLLADAQGSVRDVVRGTYADGATTTAAVDHVFLDAFGDQTTPQTATDSQYQTQIGFAGMRYIAAVELYLTPNRPYDPSTGDWLQPDPAGFDAGQTNLFEYCGNSPTNATDPSGLYGKFQPREPCQLGPP